MSTPILKTRAVDAGGFALHVEETGTGVPALVFLHYWGCSARTWSQVIEQLAPVFRCIAYDSRGWGRSGGPQNGYAIADLAKVVVAVVSDLGLDDYVLVGHSMGGKVARAVAAAHPAGLRGLVLVASAPPTPKLVPDDAREQMLSAYETKETVIATLEKMLSHKRLSDSVRQQIVEDSLSGTLGARRTWPTEAIAQDVSTNVGTIDVPVLILAGEHDQVEPVDFLRDTVVRQIPRSPFRIIRESGHLVPLEAPYELAGELRDLVAELAPPR